MNETNNKTDDEQATSPPASIDVKTVGSAVSGTVSHSLLVKYPNVLADLQESRRTGDPEGARRSSMYIAGSIDMNRPAIDAVAKMNPKSAMEQVLAQRAKSALNYLDIEPVTDAEVMGPAAVRRTQLRLGSSDALAKMTQRAKVGKTTVFEDSILHTANGLLSTLGPAGADDYANFAVRHAVLLGESLEKLGANTPGNATGLRTASFMADVVRTAYMMGDTTASRDTAVESLLQTRKTFGGGDAEVGINMVRAVTQGLEAAMQMGDKDEKTGKTIPGTGFSAVASMNGGGGKVVDALMAFTRREGLLPVAMKAYAAKAASTYAALVQSDAGYDTPEQLDVLAEAAAFESLPPARRANTLSPRARAFVSANLAADRVRTAYSEKNMEERGAHIGVSRVAMVNETLPILRQAALFGEGDDDGIFGDLSMDDVIDGVVTGDQDVLDRFKGTPFESMLDVARKTALANSSVLLQAKYGLDGDMADVLALQGTTDALDVMETATISKQVGVYNTAAETLNTADKVTKFPEASKTVAETLLASDGFEFTPTEKAQLEGIKDRMTPMTREARIRAARAPQVIEGLTNSADVQQRLLAYQDAISPVSDASPRKKRQLLRDLNEALFRVGTDTMPLPREHPGSTPEYIRAFEGALVTDDMVSMTTTPAELATFLTKSALDRVNEETWHQERSTYVPAETAKADKEFLDSLLKKHNPTAAMVAQEVKFVQAGINPKTLNRALVEIGNARLTTDIEEMRAIVVKHLNTAIASPKISTDFRKKALFVERLQEAKKSNDLVFLTAMLATTGIKQLELEANDANVMTEARNVSGSASAPPLPMAGTGDAEAADDTDADVE